MPVLLKVYFHSTAISRIVSVYETRGFVKSSVHVQGWFVVWCIFYFKHRVVWINITFFLSESANIDSKDVDAGEGIVRPRCARKFFI